MLLVSAFCCLLGAVHPPSERAPVTLDGWLAGVSVLLAVPVWSLSWRWLRHAAVVSSVGGIAAIVAVATTSAGAVSAAASFVWVVLYAAFFFSRRATRCYALACAGSFALALALNPFSGAGNVWVLMSLTMVVAAEAVAHIVRTLERQATTDPLTGLLNRDGLRTAGMRVLAQAQRSGRPLAAVIVDLDGFKLVNDRQGHAAGDRLLADLAAAWPPVLRADDVLARYGGDEFVLLLPGTATSAAVELLHRLRGASPAAWSFGLASGAAGKTLEDLLAEADADLYRVKAARSAPDAAMRRSAPDAAVRRSVPDAAVALSVPDARLPRSRAGGVRESC